MIALIEYQKIFSVEECKNNPDKLYVFGDNLARRGTGGQAIIRYCQNAIGVATKRLPSMAEDAFFTKDTSLRIVAGDIASVFETFARGSYTKIVLPTDGLGTGRAQLQERAPHILAAINKVFYNDCTN